MRILFLIIFLQIIFLQKAFANLNLNINFFSNFNDEFLIGENLKIIKIGGHTKGSCIVEIKDDNKKYIV